MDKYITHNGKQYIYTNVSLEMAVDDKNSCDLCDISNNVTNCEIVDKCDAGDHCYKLVKEDNTIMDKKRKCPRCGS